MKIICLLSGGEGHLDLGGKGYLRIALGLKSLGHNIKFITNKAQSDRLSNHGLESIVFERINKLWLIVEHGNVQKFTNEYLSTLKALELLVKKEKPAVVLVDRILGLSDGMLNYLQIPYVSIGTPGGAWKKEGKYSIQPGISGHNTNGHKDILEDALKWKFNTISIWSNSPYRCVSFVGKNYYPHCSQVSKEVNLFTNVSLPHRNELGISLGSGTFYMEEFTTKIENFLKKQDSLKAIPVFGKKELVFKFIDKFHDPIRKKMINKGYVSFDEELPMLSHLIFAGGIGTLWYCFQYGITPVIFSGHIHDQDFNEKRIKELKLFDYQVKLSEKTNKNILEYKNEMIFSDDLESILIDIVTLA